jgi:hypothetical protein
MYLKKLKIKIKIMPKLPNTIMINQFTIVATGQKCYKEKEMEEHYKQGQVNGRDIGYFNRGTLAFLPFWKI